MELAVEFKSRLFTDVQALKQCEPKMYPNMYNVLKLLSILKVSTNNTKKSFSR